MSKEYKEYRNTGRLKESEMLRESELYHMPSPHLRHRRMDVPHRAKQFAPFAALSGFEECIGRQELQYHCEGEAELLDLYEDLSPDVL